MKQSLLLVAAVFLVTLCCAFTLTSCQDEENNNNNRCVWYGDCGLSDNNRPRTCAYNGAPHPVNNTIAANRLRQKCPQYFKDTGKRPPFVYV